jgi:hypothetical protein
LVTDLPADFEVFGQAVDTSMADLKGGTTGQILSKATNADMDFTWITNDVGDITAVNTTAPLAGGGTSGALTLSIAAATTSVAGAVQLSDSTSTTSSVLAATPTAVKSAYDLANGAIPKTLIDAAGDLIIGTAADTVGRLAIGTNGQVLTSNGTTATWASSGGSNLNWTAINSGGTNLTSANTITVSSISGANHLLMTWLNASGDSTNADFEININGDTGTTYFYGGSYASGGTTDWNGSGATGTTRIRIGNLPATNSEGYGYCLISGGAATGVKAFHASMGANRTGNFSSSVGGWWDNSATISSVSVKITAGNFDAGKIYVFKSA